jgi:hypothetical protein
MSRTVVNFVLDVFLLLVTSSVLFTTAVLRFVFPAPTAAAGWKLWGQNYDAWASLQFVLVSIVGVAVVLHIMMHWSWVCGVVITRLMRRPPGRVRADDGTQTLWGVGLLILVLNILGLLVGLAYVMVEGPRGGG